MDIEIDKDYIKPSRQHLRLNQAYSSNESMTEFSILKADGTQIGAWMKCKDYIQDSIWGSKNGRGYSIHGWSFDPDHDKLPTTMLPLAVRWLGEDISKMLPRVIGTMADVEKMLGFAEHNKTRFSGVHAANGHQFFVIYLSHLWLRCIGTVSFVSWLIRVSMLNAGKKYSTVKSCLRGNDEYYFSGGERFIDKLFSRGIESFKSDWSIDDVGQVHHNGFVAYASKIKKVKDLEPVEKAPMQEVIAKSEQDWWVA